RRGGTRPAARRAAGPAGRGRRARPAGRTTRGSNTGRGPERDRGRRSGASQGRAWVSGDHRARPTIARHSPLAEGRLVPADHTTKKADTTSRRTSLEPGRVREVRRGTSDAVAFSATFASEHRAREGRGRT